jgi:hypothetical protein
VTIRAKRKGEQGFSLVEVLVAITLLIVGIVSIIQLFPPGFFVLNAIDARTRAQSAAKDALGRTSSSLSNINLIYSQIDPLTDDASFTNSVADKSVTDTTLATHYNNLGPNSQRVVSGETFSLPSPHKDPATGLFVSSYAVTFGPIWLPAADAPEQHITVRGSNWTVKVGTSYGPNTLLDKSGIPPAGVGDPSDILASGQPQCLVDYAAGMIAVPLENAFADYNARVQSGATTGALEGSAALAAKYIQTFTITVVGADRLSHTGVFTYDPGDSTLVAPPTGGTPAATSIDDQFHSLWFDPTRYVVTWSNGAPTAPWVSNTLAIKRDFVLQPLQSRTYNSIPYFDPYQFTVSSNIAGLDSAATDISLGVLKFPMSAAALRGPTGKAVTATVDYTVADWHILCEDHVASSDTVRVNAPSILELGEGLDAGDGGGNYTGIIDPRSGMSRSPQMRDLIVLNLDTGSTLTFAADYAVNYSNGRLTLSNGLARSNTQLRVFYRARHQWSVAITKAAGMYNYAGPLTASALPATNQQGLGQYWAWVDAGNPAVFTRLMFPRTDVGKTVNLGAVTIKKTDSSGAPTDSIVRIDHGGSWIVLAGPAGSSFGYIDLNANRQPDGNPVGLIPQSTGSVTYSLDTDPGQLPVRDVRGGSITVRTTYFEQSNLRHQDVTSYLYPGQ